MPVRRPARLLVVAALTAATACSGDGSTQSTSEATGAAPTTTERPDDGVLVIGAVLPDSGIAADLGDAMSDALSVGLQEINAAGGINGRRVRLVVRAEGDNPTSAGLAVQELLQLDVDAIIGPTSSVNTLSTLGTAVSAGVLTCSPTASALALDEFPDDGLFFRTIGSDSLQARAIASAVEASGGRTAAVVYLDDAYGRPFAEAVEAAIVGRGTNVAASVGFVPSEVSIAEAVDDVLATQPDVVAVVADSTNGPAIISALDAAADELEGPNELEFVVNDAIRRPSAQAQPFGASLSRRIIGVAPMAFTDAQPFNDALLAVDPASSRLYAHNAYDCLTIIALGALATGSNQPRDIAGAVPSVTSSGTACSTFTTCGAAIVEERNINYNGPSGNLSIDPTGNVATVNFARFTFDQSGRDVADGVIPVGNG